MFYDPMIAKLIVWDRDRAGAINRMVSALRDTEVVGPKTNIAFLAETVAHPEFRSAHVDTGFIDRHLTDLVPTHLMPPGEVLGLAAIALRHMQAAGACPGDPYSPWDRRDGWALGGSRRETILLTYNGAPLTLTVRGGIAALDVEHDGKAVMVSGEVDEQGTIAATVDGHVLAAGLVRLASSFVISHRGHAYEFGIPDPLDVALDESGTGGGVTAPMPGKVVQVLVKAGDRVRKGSALIVLEAMKMEQTLMAPADGTVEALSAAPGDQVEAGAVLARIGE